jgi:hypothetical protein
MMEIIVFIVTIIAGIIIGILWANGWHTDGYFIIDDSDSDKTKWILDMKENPDKLIKKNRIHLDVHVIKETRIQ